MMCKCSTHIKSEDSSSSTMNFGNQTQFVKFRGQTLILKGIAPALLETFMDIIVLRGRQIRQNGPSWTGSMLLEAS